MTLPLLKTKEVPQKQPVTLIKQMEQYAYHQDWGRFTMLSENINWENYEPDDILNIIDLALHNDMSGIAIKLAQNAQQYFPDHERVQRAARVLTPSKARSVQTTHPEGLTASRVWLQNYASDYRGYWLALKNGKVLAQAKSLQELREMVAPFGNIETMLITKIIEFIHN